MLEKEVKIFFLFVFLLVLKFEALCSLPLSGLGQLVQLCVGFPCRYHGGDVYIIDVSQSVEHDHPHALEFLRKDCANVNGEGAALQPSF